MRKNVLLRLLPSLCLLICVQINAQVKPEPKQSTQKSQKGQSKDVQVFDVQDGYDTVEKKKKALAKNIFKINPLEAIDGAFPVFYERVLSPKFSVEAGLGVTTTSSTFGALRTLLSESNEYEGLYKGKTGMMFKLGVRYYASKDDDAPDGTYFALESQIKQYKFDAYQYESIGGGRLVTGPYNPTTINNTDIIRILFGYQSENTSNFTWDTYIGLSWRKHTFNGWYQDEGTRPVLGSISTYRPVFLCGVKIGICF
jgi:hypothetical protein